MVNTVKAVAAFLREDSTVTFKVFENHRPRNVNDCITVVANGGTIIGTFMGVHDTIRKNMFIMYIRSMHYETAVQQASEVVKALQTFETSDTVEDSDIFYGVRPVGGLEPLGVDDMGRAEISLTYNMYVKE